ncbi:MAG: hypothetical protein KBG93_05085, partial [Psychrobacter sp.]|nr:hypothetical protein [Psychrobacter sp.]
EFLALSSRFGDCPIMPYGVIYITYHVGKIKAIYGECLNACLPTCPLFTKTVQRACNFLHFATKQ